MICNDLECVFFMTLIVCIVFMVMIVCMSCIVFIIFIEIIYIYIYYGSQAACSLGWSCSDGTEPTQWLKGVWGNRAPGACRDSAGIHLLVDLGFFFIFWDGSWVSAKMSVLEGSAVNQHEGCLERLGGIMVAVGVPFWMDLGTN